MNTDRILHEVEKRLAGFAQSERTTIIDALREELARERRRLDPAGTAETERERRVEAETLREILEAINRQGRLEDTIAEVLKQLSRIVLFDECSIAVPIPDGSFRVIAVRGCPTPDEMVGTTFRDPVSDAIRENRWSMTLRDVHGDDRFAMTVERQRCRSWAGIPLLVEGEVIGLLSLARHQVEPFGDEDLHRARAVAFSAAAAIRKAQLHEQIRRYAALMEQLVAVDQAVFADQPPPAVGRAILDGAHRVGNYQGGFLVLDRPGVPQIVAATGPFAGIEGRPAPAAFAVRTSVRLSPAELAPIAAEMGIEPPAQPLFLVPFQTADAYVGTLALLDPDGDSPDDRMMEAYASRAAAALLHAFRRL